MKTIIISGFILLPAFLVFSEGDSFLPNFFGLAYIAVLYMLSRTGKGRKFCSRLYDNCERINERMFNRITKD